MRTKFCSTCKQIKNTTSFWRDRIRKDGLRRECKHCERKRVLAIKTEVLTYYGNGKLTCVRCGFDDIRALSIDHIEGQGASHRREAGLWGGTYFYRWLKRNNLPTGYQTLCFNCQWIKKSEGREE